MLKDTTGECNTHEVVTVSRQWTMAVRGEDAPQSAMEEIEFVKS